MQSPHFFFKVISDPSELWPPTSLAWGRLVGLWYPKNTSITLRGDGWHCQWQMKWGNLAVKWRLILARIFLLDTFWVSALLIFSNEKKWGVLPTMALRWNSISAAGWVICLFSFSFQYWTEGLLKRTPSIIRFELQNFNLIGLTRSILNTPQVISKSRPQHIIGRNGSGSCSAVRCLPLDGCVTIDNSESGKVCDPDQEPSAGNSFLNRTQN